MAERIRDETRWRWEEMMHGLTNREISRRYPESCVEVNEVRIYGKNEVEYILNNGMRVHIHTAKCEYHRDRGLSDVWVEMGAADAPEWMSAGKVAGDHDASTLLEKAGLTSDEIVTVIATAEERLGGN
jgi:hypothetical protein